MIVKMYAHNNSETVINNIVDILKKDGVIIYPTDTVYGFACSIESSKAIERIKTIKAKKEDEMAIVCSDLSQISAFAKVDNQTFKILKRNLPGPFTFILKPSSKVPSKFLEKRKTVGIRMPNNTMAIEIVSALGMPLITTSVHSLTDEIEYTTDPELINEMYGNTVDLVIDGGYGNNEASTVVDLSEDEIIILREGLGELEY